VTRLYLIRIAVEDLDRSLGLYRRLGLELPEGPFEHGRVESTLPGGLRLAFETFETMRSFDPNWTPASGDPQTALAFLCDSPADVDRTYRELVDAGYEGRMDPWDAYWGQRYARILDPDGNIVNLFAPL
jgi:catechol 2,3-dioxygenase-like lactoylglutathione lyase family enzyme